MGAVAGNALHRAVRAAKSDAHRLKAMQLPVPLRNALTGVFGDAIEGFGMDKRLLVQRPWRGHSLIHGAGADEEKALRGYPSSKVKQIDGAHDVHLNYAPAVVVLHRTARPRSVGNGVNHFVYGMVPSKFIQGV